MRAPRMVAAALLLALVPAAACRHAQDGGSAEARVAPGGRVRLVEGAVQVAGSEPGVFVQLQPADGGAPLRLAGPLSPELRRLGGATVRVHGPTDRTGPGDGIAVTGYEVLGVDGRRPEVGVLAVEAGSVRLLPADSAGAATAAGGAGLVLADPQGTLARLAGAKVWVLVDTSTTPARVQSYGVLRDAGK
ncbi:MAG TPA: hypothetical protein VFS40_01345 [Gemmatimonadales bacterium]|nr:hypothetical protein [Gemmatimonadales bacterium]